MYKPLNAFLVNDEQVKAPVVDIEPSEIAPVAFNEDTFIEVAFNFGHVTFPVFVKDAKKDLMPNLST